MQVCLSNGHPNLWSNFNSKKLVRSETPSCIFSRVGLEGVQIAWNIAKVGVHGLYQTGIQIYDQISTPRIWSKVKLSCVVFLRLGLKQVKIFHNVVKVHVKSCVSNGHPNLWANFNFEKLLKSETLPCGFTRVGLKRGQNNSSKCYKIWRAWLFIHWASKSMIKFPF